MNNFARPVNNSAPTTTLETGPMSTLRPFFVHLSRRDGGPTTPFICGIIIASIAILLLIILIILLLRIRKTSYALSKKVVVGGRGGLKSESEHSVVFGTQPDSFTQGNSIQFSNEPKNPDKPDPHAPETLKKLDSPEMVTIDLDGRTNSPSELPTSNPQPTFSRSSTPTTMTATSTAPVRGVSPTPPYLSQTRGPSPTPIEFTPSTIVSELYNIALNPPPRSKQRSRPSFPFTVSIDDLDQPHDQPSANLTQLSSSSRSRQSRQPIPSFASDDMDGIFLPPSARGSVASTSDLEMGMNEGSVTDLPSHTRKGSIL